MRATVAMLERDVAIAPSQRMGRELGVPDQAAARALFAPTEDIEVEPNEVRLARLDPRTIERARRIGYSLK